jgi:hypothetical protein
LHIPAVNRMFSFGSNMGVHVSIHNQSLAPTFYDGFDVSVDMETDVAVSRMHVSRMAAPYGECVDDIKHYGSVFTDTLSARGRIYRQRVSTTLNLSKNLL